MTFWDEIVSFSIHEAESGIPSSHLFEKLLTHLFRSKCTNPTPFQQIWPLIPNHLAASDMVEIFVTRSAEESATKSENVPTSPFQGAHSLVDTDFILRESEMKKIFRL